MCACDGRRETLRASTMAVEAVLELTLYPSTTTGTSLYWETCHGIISPSLSDLTWEQNGEASEQAFGRIWAGKSGENRGGNGS